MSELILKYGVCSYDDYAYVSGYEGTGNIANIVATYNDYPVTRIYSNAFKDCTTLTEIDFNAVTTIMSGAFDGCTGLKKLFIPRTIEDIADDAFKNCSSLESIEADEEGYYISENNCLIQQHSGIALGCKNSLLTTELFRKHTIYEIYPSAFYGCTGLKSLDLSNINFGRFRTIGRDAFYGCTGLTSVVFNQYINEVGSNAFCGCSNLAGNIDLKNIATLGSESFSDCPKITGLTIGSYLNEFTSPNFRNCFSLATITGNSSKYTTINNCLIISTSETKQVLLGSNNSIIPSDASIVTRIGSAAFSGRNITNIVIPDNITEIDGLAFENCKLTSLSLSKYVTGIVSSYNNSFANCAETLTNIIVDPENTNYTSIDNCLIEINSKKLILGCKNSIIPADGSVISIRNYAFSKCSGLTTLQIPEVITYIDSYAFRDCVNLSYIRCAYSYSNIKNIISYCNATSYTFDISSTITTTFENNIFRENTSVAGIILCEGFTSLAWNCFYNCTNLNTISLPSTLSSIDPQSFYNCSNISNVYISPENTTYKVVENNIIEISSGKLLVGNTNGIIPTSSDITSIGRYAFSGRLMTDIVIPENIITIDTTAFTACSNIDFIKASLEHAKVILDSSSSTNVDVEAISGTLANFYSNKKIRSIILPNTLTNLTDSAFMYCTNLQTVKFKSNLTSTASLAFYECSNLTNIYFETINFNLGTLSSSGLDSVKNVYLTDLASWCEQSNPFTNMENLYLNGNLITDLVLPVDITIVGSNTFRNCKTITTLSGLDNPNLTAIKSYAFSGCTALTGILDIPANITSIGMCAFEDCTALTGLNINSSTISLDYTSFKGCSNLDFITSQSSTYPAINNCLITSNTPYYSSGKLVILGSKNCSLPADTAIRHIYQYAFANCDWLTSIHIPANINGIIEGNAFYNCKNLQNITVDSANSNFYASNNCLIDKSDQNNHKLVIIANNWVLPDNVKGIGDYAFTSIMPETITIPNTITYVYGKAFNDIIDLKEIILPTSITALGSKGGYYSQPDTIFKGCSNLEKMTLPFIGINYTPDTSSSGKYNLFGIIFGRTAYKNAIPISQELPSYSGTETFYIPASLREVTVLGGTVCDKAFNNCSMLTKVRFKNGISSIGSYVLENCGILELSETDFDTKFTSIPYGLCRGCINLISVAFSNNITYIGSYAFSRCSGLANITMSNNLTGIGDGTFAYCYGLTEILIPNELTYIGSDAFRCSDNIKKVTVNSLEHWSKITFSTGDTTVCNGGTSNPTCYSKNLYVNNVLITDFILPSNLTYIGSNQFINCKNMKSVTIPKNVSEIGQAAFSGCNNLNIVKYNNVKEKWEQVYISSYNEPLYNADIYYTLYWLSKYKDTNIQIDSTICDSEGDNISERYLKQKLYNINNINTEAEIADCNTKINELLAILRAANIIRKEG